MNCSVTESNKFAHNYKYQCLRIMLCSNFLQALSRMDCVSGCELSDVKQEEDPLLVTDVKSEQVR
jgi:hypothetical protein